MYFSTHKTLYVWALHLVKKKFTFDYYYTDMCVW